MADLCGKCTNELPPDGRICPVCGKDGGTPNVRIADRPAERAALERRIETAEASANATNSKNELRQFARAVDASVAIMNRSLGALSSWVNGPSPLFLSFHRQVETLGRIPDDTPWDQQREAAESTINPFCYRDINFAALSLDDVGMAYYGPYSVTISDLALQERASVFEENPFTFNRRHHVFGGASPPLGYRATWPNRSGLAVAKLHAKITAGMPPEEFSLVLMENRRNDSDCDFVEVHVYGPLHRASIASVVGPVPKRPADALLWKQASRKLRELGATVAERKA